MSAPPPEAGRDAPPAGGGTGVEPALPRAARRAVALTRAGLWWEALAASFWPPAALAAGPVAALALGVVAGLDAAGVPGWTLAALGGFWALLFAATALAGWLRFRAPRRAEALARVDRRLAGRPLSALGDRMALGGPEAAALWEAHLDRAWAAAAAARPVVPDAGLVRRDPYGLRLMALTALVMAVVFGGLAPAGQGLSAMASGWRPLRDAPDPGAPAGPAWEGWAEPPAYTRRPTIYLNALEAEGLVVPEGTVLSFRLYGDGLAVAQDVGEPLAEPAGAAGAPEAVRLERITARRDGTVSVGDRRFALTVTPDAAPEVSLAALATRRADGRLAQGFSARDDNGVAAGTARIALDLQAVDRRFGLAPDPEPREALSLPLPLPAAGARRQVQGTLGGDLARHPWANLPVRITLEVQDGIGQTGATSPVAMVLPGRRFFDPLAAGLAEVRRDLMWSRDNAARSARLIRAMVWRPDRAVPDDAARAIVAAVQALEAGPLTPEARDAVAEGLWTAAVAIEDGGLSDALARMRQAQERLSQAIRQGASPDEIARLMDELKAATDAYTEMLAQQGEDPAARFDRSERPVQEITGDQIQQMMDEIQRLMTEGRMSEAAELLDQFNRMMENLEMREGGAGGEGAPGSRAQRRLSETLREQQDLADEALREAQRDPFGLGRQGMDPESGAAPGEGADGAGPEGAQPGEPGAGAGEGEGEAEGGSLADRQRGLREELGRQRGLMPGRGTPEGEAAGREIDRAGRAMEDAERALRDGDPAGAMDRQAEAIEALREGMRALGDLAARQGGERGQPGDQGTGEDGQAGMTGRAQGEGEGRSDRPGRDPLGRDRSGQGGNIASGEALAEGERQAGRARELQDEIRRRAGEPARPRAERDYLGRLLGAE
ncbi:DUF4175 domain-containing protein [Paracoccus panacisoli]|uniref:DUF4175 domain-containing protein n=1 Tax=Paracoccus panacisoli TaxID=1510163 RepID=A0ABV6T0R5_9RHOB